MMDVPITQEARSIGEVVIACHAPDDYFEDDISDEVDAECAANGPIPCEGGGYVGLWCQDCRFSKIFQN